MAADSSWKETSIVQVAYAIAGAIKTSNLNYSSVYTKVQYG